MNNRKFSKNMDDKTRNIIINAAYNDVPFLQKREIMKLIRENEEAAKLFNEHYKVAVSLNSLKTEKCPDEIVQAARSRLILPESKNSFIQNIYLIFFKKPVVTFAVTLSVLLIISLAVFTKRGKTEIEYSPQQVAIAKEQTEQVLSVVGKIFLSSQHILETNILGKQVGTPIKTGIEEVNKLFNTGG